MVDVQQSSRTTLYVRSAVVLAVVQVVATLLVVWTVPRPDRASAIGAVAACLTPLIATLIAGAIQQVHLGMNSRLTELVDATRKAAFEGGRAMGKQDSDDEHAARRTP